MRIELWKPYEKVRVGSANYLGGINSIWQIQIELNIFSKRFSSIKDRFYFTTKRFQFPNKISYMVIIKLIEFTSITCAS